LCISCCCIYWLYRKRYQSVSAHVNIDSENINGTCDVNTPGSNINQHIHSKTNSDYNSDDDDNITIGNINEQQRQAKALINAQTSGQKSAHVISVHNNDKKNNVKSTKK